jgi:hypothetical protein
VGASGDGQELDLLRIKSKEKCQRGRQREGEEIGEGRRRGVHRRRRNRPGKPADLRISVDEIRRPRFVPSGETKGREERGVRASYRRGSRTKRAGINQD